MEGGVEENFTLIGGADPVNILSENIPPVNSASTLLSG
jgi:hypothetical protein